MSETAAATTEKHSNKKQLGDYRMPASDIPESLRGQVAKTLGVESESLKMASAREGGSYYGKVLHADSNFIVQGVGKEGKSAVIHRASDIEFMSSSLKWRAENGRLGRGGESAANLQVHYAANGEPSKTARAYAYRSPEHQAQRESSKPEPAKATPEKTEKAPSAKAEPATEKPKATTPQKADVAQEKPARTTAAAKPEKQADTPARTRKSRSKSADMER